MSGAGGRPKLPPGAWGEIACWEVSPGQWRAKARFRDSDGWTRDVSRFGPDRGKATAKLRAALAERARSGRLDRDTTVRQLAKLWLEGVQRSDRSARTREHYEYVVNRYVVDRIGALRVAEVDTRVCDELLRATAVRSKAGARTVRAVLNGMFRLAVAHGAANVNPVRETEKIAGAKKRPRALSATEMTDLSDRLRTLPRALPPQAEPRDEAEKAGLDLADLVDFMLATGCRIGEALAARHMADVDGNPLLDLEAGTWEINATVIRLKGIGVVIQERPKTAAGWRVLALPASVVEMVKRRQTDPLRIRPATVRLLNAEGDLRAVEGAGIVFPSPFAPALRDPSNLAGDLREVLDALGYDWVTSHTFRKSVATRLDEAGWTSRQVADQLGHANPSMTLDVYFGRRVVNGDAANVLER